MPPHPRCHPRSLVAVFRAAPIQRHFIYSASIGSTVVGIEHRRIDDEHLVGLIGSKKTFGAPPPFPFRVAFHAGGLYDYVDFEVRELGIIVHLEENVRKL